MAGRSKNLISPIIDPVVDYFNPQPKPSPNAVTWLCYQVTLICYVAWDAAGRIRRELDGLDKSNKLLIGVCAAVQKSYEGSGIATPVADLLSGRAKGVNDFIGGLGLFGRIQDLTGVEKGEWTLMKRDPLKIANITFLTIAKGAELLRWFQTVDLLPVKWFAAADAQYLGGLASAIGQTQVAKVLDVTSLSGVKNFFVVLSSSYGLLESSLMLLDGKHVDGMALLRNVLAILNEIGKIVLTLWFRWFAFTWTFVAFAVVIPIVALSKILVDSYTKDPLKLPSWAAKV